MPFKYIIGTIAIIVLTSAGLVVFGINTLLDRNRDAIISEMERYTGRRISLSGITTSFTDGIGVQLDQFSIGDDPKQAVGHFLKADRLKLNFSLSSLYSDQPEIREAILYRPTINVQRHSDGTYNFGVLTPKVTGDSESVGTAPETARQTPKVSLLVSLLEISEGTIHYTDELTDSSVTITSIGLQGRDLDLAQISHIQLEAAIHSTTPNVSLSLDAGPFNSNLNGLDAVPVIGTIRIQQVSLNKLRRSFPSLANFNTAFDSFAGPLNVVAEFAGTPGEISLTGVEATLSYPKAETANLTIEGDVGPLNLQQFRLEPGCNIDLTMRLTALELRDISESWAVTELLSDSTQDNGGPIDFVLSAKGTPEKLVLTGLLDATGMSLKVQNYFVKPAEVSLTLNSRAVLSDKTLRTNKLELNLGPLTLRGTGYLTLDDQKQINFDFSSNEIDLYSLRPFLPFIMRTNVTGKASTKFKIDGTYRQQQQPRIQGELTVRRATASPPLLAEHVEDVNATLAFVGEQVTLKKGSFRVGRSSFRVTGTTQKLTPLDASFDLSTALVHLKEVVPLPWTGMSENTNLKGRIWSTTDGRRYRIRVESSGGEMASAEYNNFQLEISGTDAQANINQLRFGAFGGKLEATGHYSLEQNSPRFSLNGRINGADAYRLSHLLADHGNYPISGSASLEFATNGKMNAPTILGSEITGSGTLSIKEGAIHHLNLTDALLSQLDIIPGFTLAPSKTFKNKYPFLFASKHTEFDRLAVTFALKNQQIALTNVRIETEEVVAHSEGSLDFDGNIDATGSLIVSPEVTRQIIRDVSEIRHLTDASDSLVVPFYVSGQIPTLKPRADVSQMGKILKQALIKLAEEGIRKRILDGLRPTKDAKEKSEAMPKTPSSGSSAEAATTPGEPTLEELLVEKGLDLLFGR